MSSFNVSYIVNAKIEAINEFMAVMIERFEVIEEIKELAEKFKENLDGDKPSVSVTFKDLNEAKEKKVKKPRVKKIDSDNIDESKDIKKRGPSLYNIFVKEHMSEFKNVPSKSRMAEIGLFWKNSAKGRFFANRQKEIKLHNTVLNSKEIYDIISNEWRASASSSGEDETSEVTM
jgi:hypothetical protein